MSAPAERLIQGLSATERRGDQRRDLLGHAARAVGVEVCARVDCARERLPAPHVYRGLCGQETPPIVF